MARPTLPARPVGEAYRSGIPFFDANSADFDLHQFEDDNVALIAQYPEVFTAIRAMETRMVALDTAYASDRGCAGYYMELTRLKRVYDAQQARQAWIDANPTEYAAEQAALAQAKADREAALS